MASDLFVGLISGTSVDGIDAALVRFGERSVDVAATLSFPYPPELRAALLEATRQPATCTVDRVGDLDARTGLAFREAALALLNTAGMSADSVAAIGSHGQTLRHCPDSTPPFTLQIGDPSIIATGLGVVTVADFRRQDVALGGQGAPLTPPFHQWLFQDADATTAVVNIGGIANITCLPAGAGEISGYDTGPGNTLLDAWIRKHHGDDYDADGRWAASGNVQPDLLSAMLEDPYLKKPAPKSTGFEYFNLDWLDSFDTDRFDPADVQATLTELTAESVAEAVTAVSPKELYVCGGGAHNRTLMARLDALLPATTVSTTASRGLDPDWVEAVAFAWLARERLLNRPGNAPSVTGASRRSLLGAVYQP